MKYKEALQLKNESQELLGQVDSKGFCVGDIIIVPINPEMQKVFFGSYLWDYDDDAAISPYINEELQVWAIDVNRIRSHGLLIYNILG